MKRTFVNIVMNLQSNKYYLMEIDWFDTTVDEDESEIYFDRIGYGLPYLHI